MSAIVAGYFPHLPPTPAPVGVGAEVPKRDEEEKRERSPSHSQVRAVSSLLVEERPLRARIMDYVSAIMHATGEGPTLAEIETFLGGEGFLAQGQVYWLEGEGYLRAERVEGNRRRLRSTSKEYGT